ncbi:EAL domain-containing protein [Cytobacillus spongiae]|uniref:EAL domain-containing protein n=1 Tax=Cytobacillus spongiae TaxID=2901381 RepID=UPI001F29156E|nr:EAL domain-containing protein [Cytobacillus spongiae]UII57039.1 EAL domain-containing protein [Cytobacillus spongiae]
MTGLMNRLTSSAQLVETEEDLIMRKEFRSILMNKSLTMFFQPIINFRTGDNFGFEALTRGPLDSKFHSPLHLFQYAEKLGLLYPLEKIARELAFKNSHSLLQNGEKLFINISSQVVHDPSFTPGHTASLLEQFDVNPEEVVFEITERSAIEDFTTFREALNHYRDQGFEIAIDDAGAGYSSLQAISEIMPDYIKIDRSLISNIDENDVKKHILEAFVTFAQKMNSTIIAEGIETSEELRTVMDLGIDCGQGYYLARPNFPVKEVPKIIINEIIHYHAAIQSALKPRTFFVNLDDEIIIMDNNQVLKKSIANRLI